MGYTRAEIIEVSKSVLATYPNPALSEAYATFEWEGNVLPDAENRRTALTAPLLNALAEDNLAALEAAASEIYYFGFGNPLPANLTNNPNFLNALRDALNAFLADAPTRGPDLIRLLSFRRVGIATASKWICFLDQAQFGIYDSRVSIALRNVTVGGYRAFPIVARRAGPNQQPFRHDAFTNTNPTRTTRAYLDYLKVLQAVAAVTGLSTAQVEMALFMLGDVWADGHPALRPLREGMWG